MSELHHILIMVSKTKTKKKKRKKKKRVWERKKKILAIITYLSWNRFWMSFSAVTKNSSSSDTVGMVWTFDEARQELISTDSVSSEFSRCLLERFISFLKCWHQNYYCSELYIDRIKWAVREKTQTLTHEIEREEEWVWVLNWGNYYDCWGIFYVLLFWLELWRKKGWEEKRLDMEL